MITLAPFRRKLILEAWYAYDAMPERHQLTPQLYDLSSPALYQGAGNADEC